MRRSAIFQRGRGGGGARGRVPSGPRTSPRGQPESPLKEFGKKSESKYDFHENLADAPSGWLDLWQKMENSETKTTIQDELGHFLPDNKPYEVYLPNMPVFGSPDYMLINPPGTNYLGSPTEYERRFPVFGHNKDPLAGGSFTIDVEGQSYNVQPTGNESWIATPVEQRPSGGREPLGHTEPGPRAEPGQMDASRSHDNITV